MTGRKIFYALLTLGVAAASAQWISARQNPNPPSIHVSVEMVQLDVAVTDRKGNYITDLKPADFVVSEDGIQQKMAMFGEGDNPPRRLTEIAEDQVHPAAPTIAAAPNPAPPAAPLAAAPAVSSNIVEQADDSPLAGASVFVLFDTSNYMYRGFVFAQDAISNFVRSLQGPDRIAVYSYSRNLFRAATLTPDRNAVLRSVRTTVAGDSAALYDSILLTLRDAQRYTGRRVIVVFSNGPDSSSLAPPEDVEELAQSEGVAIYMISTRQAEMEPLSTKVFERISTSTGGESFFAKNWNDEEKAFAAIREDLGHLYSLYYYPEANPNRGWRAITVKLPGSGNKFRVRTRSGYRPLPARSEAGAVEGN